MASPPLLVPASNPLVLFNNHHLLRPLPPSRPTSRPLSPPPSRHLMSSFNARFKNLNLGFAKRKSSASIKSPDSLDQPQRYTPTPPPPPPPPGSAGRSSVSIPGGGATSPPPAAAPFQQQQQDQQRPPSVTAPQHPNSSQQSLPQMNHPGQGQRPPSYTAGYPGGSLPSFWLFAPTAEPPCTLPEPSAPKTPPFTFVIPYDFPTHPLPPQH